MYIFVYVLDKNFLKRIFNFPLDKSSHSTYSNQNYIVLIRALKAVKFSKSSPFYLDANVYVGSYHFTPLV